MLTPSNLSDNLRLLCSYCPSISAVCRDIGISRQQFTKYLSGSSQPSLSTLRKILDYFGVEEHELLLPKDEFHDLVAVRPPVPKVRHPSQDYFSAGFQYDAASRSAVEKFIGYYYSHFVMGTNPGKMVRSLISIYEHKGTILTKNVERFPDDSDGAAIVKKYDGVALYNAERLFIYERERPIGDRIWQTVVYATDLRASKFLSGLTMGIATDSVRDIQCYRVVYNFLGQEIDLRTALRGCGKIDLDSKTVPKYVRDRITNDMRPGENAFVPR